MLAGPERSFFNYEFIKNPENFFRLNKPATDNDGVMSDTRTLVTGEFNKIFRTNHRPEDIRHWHAIRDWGIESGLSFEEATKLELFLWFDPVLLYKAQPVAGAVEISRWFYERGIPFPVISSRRDLVVSKGAYKNIKDSTIAWYEKWMPWVLPDDIHIQYGQEMKGEYYKAFMIKRMGIGVFFEDIPLHAQAILDYTDANIVLVSNRSLFPTANDNRIASLPYGVGKMPDLLPFYNLLTNINV